MLLDLTGQSPALLQVFPYPQAAAEAPPDRPQGFSLLKLPARPFFISTGWAKTSSAPASRSAS